VTSILVLHQQLFKCERSKIVLLDEGNAGFEKKAWQMPPRGTSALNCFPGDWTSVEHRPLEV
jgi:hypothetical protein